MISTQICKEIAWILLFAVVLVEYRVQGVNLRYRAVCYPNDNQPNCDTEFVDVYKNLSTSTLDRTVADTWFWLFTRRNPETPELLHKCGGKLPPNTNFNAENELIVIVVPYMAGFCDCAVYREWLVQILEKGDYNVLVVDWTWGSKTLYNTAKSNSEITAKQTVIVLQNIQDETGITKDKISIVGHSMGAHLAGIIGQEFKVARITGIDPAGPAYTEVVSNDEKLDPSDADFVDVWHTNGGDCLPYLGTNYDHGHVDFWINDGHSQPSCYREIIPALLTGNVIYGIGTILPTACSHAQCAQFYKYSINPGNCQYVGIKCDSYKDFKRGKCRSCGKNGENCLIMGFDTIKYIKDNPNYRGRYYVKTSNTCPYCDNSHLKFQGFLKTYRSSLQ